MQKITPFLWFDRQAEQAAKFYSSVFKSRTPLTVTRYSKGGGPGKPGSVMTVQFRILGQEFTALNAGPQFTFNPAISFVVRCRTQKEIDYYWRKLSTGGKEVQCGWLEDRYGVSWQIVPVFIMDLISAKHPERSERVMKAVMTMVKLDIRLLKQAAKGK
jgi:predicted 3-demethylubiquinone-9 3-methyltransferase (glyoxalase superfamily)